MVNSVDVAVVGGGIAGISIASEVARSGAKVAVFEVEHHAPWHATARSAALSDPSYVPNEDVAILTVEGGYALERIEGALHPKEVLHLFGANDLGQLVETYSRSRNAGANVEILEPDDLAARFPFLRVTPEFCEGAIFAPSGVANTIDVDRVYQHASSLLRMRGGKILLNKGVESAVRCGRGWTIRTRAGEIRADVLVNAAGAWADEVASICGVEKTGLVALRRTILETTLEDTGLVDEAGGPFIFWDREPEDLYCELKSGGRVLISPADETHSLPCDAYPNEEDVAASVQRFHERTKLTIRQARGHERAGLRSFASDRKPIIGPDCEVEGFFWAAAFGGFGIECSVAAARMGAAMVMRYLGQDQEIPLASLVPAFDPGRFRPRIREVVE